MKTRILIIFGILSLIPISVLFTVDNAYALCTADSDWPERPCYGCRGCYPGLEQEKLDWAPYYDYKDSTWMDAKKQQLETAIQNNSLREWFEQSDSGSHKNVHHYYFLQGEVPNIYGMNFAEALNFERAWNAVENNSPDAPMLLWNYHDVILDGTLIETDLAVTIEGDHVPLYTIKVNKYFKGEKNSDIITAVENPDDLEFNLFENGLFYLKKLENQNWYTATIASAKTFGICEARDLIEISPVLPNEKPPISTPVNPEGFVDPCIPEYYDVDPDENVFKDDVLVPEPEQDVQKYENCGPGTTLQNGVCLQKEENTTSSTKWSNPYQKMLSPLKQLKSGIEFHNIDCKEGLELVYKKADDTSACVTLETKIELIIRGWAEDDRLLLGCTPSRHETCYPSNPQEYRKALYDYHFDDTDLPSSESFDFASIHVINACSGNSVCFGNFENGTKIRVSCDFPMHGCGVLPFDEYKTTEKSVEWKKYITVSASRIDETPLPDMLKIQPVGELSENKILIQLINGADGCKDETEMCALPRGVSIERTNPLGIRVGDHDDYTVSLDEEKANNLLSQLEWTIEGNWIYSVLEWNQNYYFVVLSTFDNVRTPDVKMKLIDTSLNPVKMEAGEILNYAIQLETWATYGPPAKIDLRAVQGAKDSGIKVWIEPDVLEIPERSNATATLFIQSSDDAKDGIYDVRVIGRANGNLADLYCSRTTCPTINIGDSDWSIRTFDSSSGMGIGSGESPENTWIEIELDKNQLLDGDILEIKSFVINNGTEPIVLDVPQVLVKVIRADSSGYYDHFYGIDAEYVSEEPLVLEPKSKTMLVRPFYWDQMILQDNQEQRIDPSERKITLNFVGGPYSWNTDIWFEIK